MRTRQLLIRLPQHLFEALVLEAADRGGCSLQAVILEVLSKKMGVKYVEPRRGSGSRAGRKKSSS